MSNKLFDVLRYLSEVFFPALVVLLGVVFANVPIAHSEAILAIVGAVGVFLGALINYKRNAYNKSLDESEG